MHRRYKTPKGRGPYPNIGATMNQDIKSFVIVGVTSAGKRFRPSDWADRLCGIMSAFGSDHRMKYSPFVRPGGNEKGEKTVFVDARLYQIEPLAYKFLQNFAADNDLQLEIVDQDNPG